MVGYRGLNPAFSEFTDFNKRLSTYDGVDITYLQQNKQLLAEAGFFYAGQGSTDDVICYSCGGGLRDWHIENIPWIEHAIHFNRCKYLIVCKGWDFIHKHSLSKIKESKQMCQTKQTVTTEVEQLQCLICITNEKDALIIPCKHLCVCKNCVQKLKNCPICREVIITSIDVYITYSETQTLHSPNKIINNKTENV